MGAPQTPQATTADPAQMLRKFLTTMGPLLALLIVIVIFRTICGEHFLSMDNIRTVLANAAIVTIAALGMTVIIIGGGIDLSTGSMVALSSVICAKVLVATGLGDAGIDPPTLKQWISVFAVGIGTGMLCGAVNGLAIVILRVVPFIATLGMLSLARGVAKWQANNTPINVAYTFGDWTSEPLGAETLPAWLQFAPSVWLMLVLAIVVGVMLQRTVFGRHIVALGSNEQTARLCGLKTNWLKIALYTLGGAFAGLAGVVQTGRLTQGDPSVAVGLELNVIAAVVIGGGSLMGGEGRVLGTLAGALIMAVLANGATQAGWANYVQEILVGVIIVIAVALDQWRARKLAH